MKNALISSKNEKVSRSLGRMVQNNGLFDQWEGEKRYLYEFKELRNVVTGHSCLPPKFSITLRVGELRRIIESMEDDAGLNVTIAHQQAPKFTFVR